jgi:hypothetical protein
MTTETILSKFDDLNTWKQGDQRAPHKPLLVLYALGRWQQGKRGHLLAGAKKGRRKRTDGQTRRPRCDSINGAVFQTILIPEPRYV